ncbi:MAG: DUF1501 domain-containing protein [Planctomycetia bacterium]|nr:DUF1501 domain-containing protein [Planctomycetia bacterium]
MLSIYGPATRYCDGISRRSFLKIGSFVMGGMASLSLPQILRAESASGRRSSHKAVINIFLGGGPPHQDLWDIKTEAPVEIRGEFQPIDTKVPGIQIGEVFPKIAALADKAVFVRSVVGCPDRHEAFHCYTGWTQESLRSLGGRPSIGAALARLKGPVDRSVPPFVGLAARTQHSPWSDAGTTGFLGAAYSPFKPEGETRNDLTLNGISADRLGDRQALLTSLDNLKREADSSGMIDGMDAFTQAAFGVLTSSKLLEAMDLRKEDPKVIDRYGTGKPYNYQFDGAPTCNDQLLMARRLVEAGVRCVTLTFGRWDSHGDNFKLVRDHGGKLDQCVSALVQDLDERGMLRDVTVAVWGEFGRTPRINGGRGRDHWPQVSCALLLGGGMRTGQVIGSTNRLGEHADDRPVHFQEIVSTIYHNLGIDTQRTAIVDPTGRPQYLVERPPMREVV